MRQSGVFAALALVAALSVMGCGGDPTAEDVLSDAQESLRGAREAVLAASEALKDKEEALVAAQSEVDQAREAVRTAQSGLTEIEAKVDLKATDGLLFRAIQRRILDDDRLESTAIRVKVEKGVVTLVGEVPDGEAKEVALEIARSVPGVASVESQLSIAVAAPAD